MTGAARGFTLIELLVVVAIIALLVTILMPSLKRAKELAKAVICQSNLRALATGAHVYAMDHSEILPPGGLNNRWNDQYALRILKPYVNEDSSVSTIGRTKHNTWRSLRGETPPLANWPSRVHCPSYMNDVRQGDDWRHVSWSFCFLDGGALTMFQENPHRSYPQDYPWAKLLDFHHETVLFLGGSAWYTNLGSFNPYGATGRHARFCHPNDTVNMVFADTHVEPRTRDWADGLTADDMDRLRGK
jgi:prepilin-type N-terminal cleavage/methylation domain-containing protein/prepilin-type processing-associated H-X9-DG protein